jgi:hypothetical protein
VFRYQASALTASGDTTETEIGSLVTPKAASWLHGVYAYGIAGAAITTAEAPTGIVSLESRDYNLQPIEIPLDLIVVLTSGAAAINPKLYLIRQPALELSTITGYVTMDMAQTGALKARFILVWEFPDTP